MKQLTCIVLTIVSAFIFRTQAQTPYDSFAPESTRPMLGLDALHAMKQESTRDTLFCIVALDVQQQVLLLINAEDGRIIAYSSLTDDLHKWMSVDPLADKYPGVSPYAYCHWNPVKYVDPDGREITITGEDGETITYVPGGKYEGNDSFTMKMWSQLDEIYSTKSGGIVLNELVNDKGKAFNVNSQLAKGPNGLDVKGYTPGKRLLRIGGEVQGAEALAHEFFHAYQDLHGYGGASCANDVEAYLFQGLVYSELYGGDSFGAYSTFELQPIDNQSMYFNTYADIMTDGMLNTDRLNNLANGFSAYSRAGANGIAENYTTFSKNQQYRILNFWRR